LHDRSELFVLAYTDIMGTALLNSDFGALDTFKAFRGDGVSHSHDADYVVNALQKHMRVVGDGGHDVNNYQMHPIID
jgi:hypothetical protein